MPAEVEQMVSEFADEESDQVSRSRVKVGMRINYTLLAEQIR
jgi:hypothetical protein